MSFANQALSAEFVVKNSEKLQKKVYSVPKDIDEKIAAGAYDGNAGALRRDLLLIGSNCIAFNANNPWWFALGNNWCTAVEKCYHDAVGKHEAKRAADAKRFEAWRKSRGR